MHIHWAQLGPSPKNITFIDNVVTFSGGIIRLVSNWNLLVSISYGEIKVDPKYQFIEYKIDFSQLIVIGSLMVALMDILAFLSGAPIDLLIFGTPFMLFWLIGMNIFISIPRFHSFLKTIIESSGYTIIKG